MQAAATAATTDGHSGSNPEVNIHVVTATPPASPVGAQQALLEAGNLQASPSYGMTSWKNYGVPPPSLSSPLRTSPLGSNFKSFRPLPAVTPPSPLSPLMSVRDQPVNSSYPGHSIHPSPAWETRAVPTSVPFAPPELPTQKAKDASSPGAFPTGGINIPSPSHAGSAWTGTPIFRPYTESVQWNPIDRRPGIDSDAEIWKSYLNEAAHHDRENITSWNQSMDVMLVFAGLFSAILTAFIIEFYKNLQPDPQQTAADLLLNISQTLQGPQLGSVGYTPQAFTVPAGELVANILWFSSLACSLGAAMIAMVVKQWLQFYTLGLDSGTPYDYAHKRQYRYNALLAWHVPGIISALPMLMHVSVMLFFVALVLQLWQINTSVAIVTLTLISVFILTYMVTLFLPWIYFTCPYKSSALVLLQQSMHYFHTQWWKLIYRACLILGQISSRIHLNIRMPIKTVQRHYRNIQSLHEDKEPKKIAKRQYSLDINGIIWLSKMSQKQDVVDLALKSIAQLHYTNDFVTKLLENNVIDVLIQKANVSLPPDGHDFWERFDEVTPQYPAFAYLADATDYMYSLISIWHHPSYFESSLPLLQLQQETQSWLFGDWLRAWRLLCKRYQNDAQALKQHGWNLDMFSMLICTEMYYYHLQHKSQFNSSCHTAISMSKSDDSLSPIADLYYMLQISSMESHPLGEHTICRLLDTFAYILSSIEHRSDILKCTDILLALLQLLDSRQMKYDVVLQKVVLCIQMFILDTSIEKIAIMENHQQRKSQKDLFICISLVLPEIIQHHYPQTISNTQADPIIIIAIHQLYKSLLQQSQPSPMHNSVFIDLPEKYSNVFLEAIAQEQLYQWKTMKTVDWFIDLMSTWILSAHLSSDGTKKVVSALSKLMTIHWSDEELNVIAKKIIPFLLKLMNGVNKAVANAACEAFCDIMQESVQIGPKPNRRPLQYLLDESKISDMRVWSNVCKFINLGATTSEPLVSKWAQFAEVWSQDLLKHGFDPKENQAYTKLCLALAPEEDDIPDDELVMLEDRDGYVPLVAITGQREVRHMMEIYHNTSHHAQVQHIPGQRSSLIHTMTENTTLAHSSNRSTHSATYDNIPYLNSETSSTHSNIVRDGTNSQPLHSSPPKGLHDHKSAD